MRSTFLAFLADRRGAVNVEWVTLTASLLLLGIATLYVIYGAGVQPVVAGVNGTLDTGIDPPIGPTPSF